MLFELFSEPAFLKNTSPRCFLHRTVAGYLLFQCIPGDVHPSGSTHRKQRQAAKCGAPKLWGKPIGSMGRLYICLHENHKHQPKCRYIFYTWILWDRTTPHPLDRWLGRRIIVISRVCSCTQIQERRSKCTWQWAFRVSIFGRWNRSAVGNLERSSWRGPSVQTYPDRPCRELCICLLVSDNENPPNSPLDTNALRKGSS